MHFAVGGVILKQIYNGDTEQIQCRDLMAWLRLIRWEHLTL